MKLLNDEAKSHLNSCGTQLERRRALHGLKLLEGSLDLDTAGLGRHLLQNSSGCPLLCTGAAEAAQKGMLQLPMIIHGLEKTRVLAQHFQHAICGLCPLGKCELAQLVARQRSLEYNNISREI